MVAEPAQTNQSLSPVERAPLTTPIDTKAADDAERRARRAQYMRVRRATKAKKTQRKEAAVRADDAATVVAKQAELEAKAAAERAAAEQRAADEARAMAERAAKLAETEAGLRVALAGTIEALADGVHGLLLDAGRPHLGTERAAQVAGLWAPLLAPHMTEDTARHLPLLMASAGTVGVMLAWRHEYQGAPR